jgi:hypothetical protein
MAQIPMLMARLQFNTVPRRAVPRAQRLRLGFGQAAVQGGQFEPGEKDLPGHRGGQPGGVDREVMGGEVVQASGSPPVLSQAAGSG